MIFFVLYIFRSKYLAENIRKMSQYSTVLSIKQHLDFLNTILCVSRLLTALFGESKRMVCSTGALPGPPTGSNVLCALIPSLKEMITACKSTK